ncbi:MAG: hypothetical protein KME12_17920 [Trichocoleus desertorum ATA4-8-CV12]|jgi:hypothetical protein|nr:hypothetical protein [Trichocoleus desertorum ATA4-8-CV12]
MKKALKQTIVFGLMTCLTTLMVIGSGHIGQAQPASIPEFVKPCIPSRVRPPIVRTELIAQASSKENTYFLLYTFHPDEAGGTDLVISVVGSQCREEFYNAPGDAVSLTQIVERNVANQLALGRYQNEIRRWGRAKVQANVNRVIAAQGLFYPEDLWALRQLGFKLPANTQVSQ